jgi:membrane protease YdiL (CAAX protease family)
MKHPGSQTAASWEFQVSSSKSEAHLSLHTCDFQLETAHRRPPGTAGLALETGLVTLGTVGALAVLNAYGAAGTRWLAIPALLLAAALIPVWAGRAAVPRLGLDRAALRAAGPIVSGVCSAAFPAAFLGLWLLTLAHVPIPLRPPCDGGQNWPAWLLYQFLYVAVAEEVFFRGYVQANTARVLGRAARLSGLWRQRIAILVSAAAFALAHVAVQGQITSLLVFLPGLVLAWLFARTGSLLAPILFHGLANVFYGVAAAVLT